MAERKATRYGGTGPWHRHGGRLRSAACVVTLVVGVLLARGPASADAMPLTAPSFYWTTTNVYAAEEEGCFQGIADALDESNSEVILDFGGQLSDLSGTKSLSKTFNFTNIQIEDIALGFHWKRSAKRVAKRGRK
jgi:hypothetical protein